MDKTILLSQVKLGDKLIMRGNFGSKFFFEGVVIWRDNKFFLKSERGDNGWHLLSDQQKYWTLELVER